MGSYRKSRSKTSVPSLLVAARTKNAQHRSAGAKIAWWAMLLVVLWVVGQLAYLSVRPLAFPDLAEINKVNRANTSEERLVWWSIKYRPPNSASYYVGIDRGFAQLAGDGNVFMGFQGFDPRAKWAQVQAATVYFRATYSLYPRRVWVNNPDKLIYDEDLLRSDFLPTTAWLKEHDVRTVVMFTPGPNNQFVPNIQKVIYPP